MISLIKRWFPGYHELTEIGIEEENNEEYLYWKWITIVIPIFIIVTSVILYALTLLDDFSFLKNGLIKFSFTKSDSDLLNHLKDKIFNGSIPLTSVALLVANLFILVRYNRENEKKLGLKQISVVRSKLLIGVVILLLTAWGLYFVENFMMPKGVWGTTLFFISSITVLIISVMLSLKIFFMQESFIASSLDIKSPIHLSSKNLQGTRLSKKPM